MTDYNVIAEVGVAPPVKRAEEWMVRLVVYSPAVGRTDRGHSELIITVPARTIGQAVATGVAIMSRAVGQIQRFEVLTTAEYDGRADDVHVPELIGATEAREVMGVSRQRIQQLARAGELPSTTVGKSLVFPRANVDAMAAKRNDS